MSVKRPSPDSDTFSPPDDTPNMKRRKETPVKKEISPFFLTHDVSQNCNTNVSVPRLSSELVKELETLVVPGSTEMPSYEIRKHLQTHYGVDRRHIYDWFRNRGLRVKEERNNSSPARAPRLSRPPKQTNVHQAVRVSADALSTFNTPCQNTQDVFGVGSLPALDDTDCYSDSSYNLFGPLGSQSPYSLGHYSPTALTYTPSEQNIYEDTASLYSLSSSPVTSEISDTYYFHQIPSLPCTPEFDDLSFRCCEVPTEDESVDLVHLDQRPLCQEERKAAYNFLSQVLGPACGIQESVGTYDAYMRQQSHVYFERLVAPHRKPTKRSRTLTRDHDVLRIPPPQYSDFMDFLTVDQEDPMGIEPGDNLEDLETNKSTVIPTPDTSPVQHLAQDGLVHHVVNSPPSSTIQSDTLPSSHMSSSREKEARQTCHAYYRDHVSELAYSLDGLKNNPSSNTPSDLVDCSVGCIVKPERKEKSSTNYYRNRSARTRTSSAGGGI